jgi:hypothetical protein
MARLWREMDTIAAMVREQARTANVEISTEDEGEEEEYKDE